MVVMTQDQMQTIPYENFVFSVSDNAIVCDKDIITAPSEISRRIIARYDTKERAIEVLEEMTSKYASYYEYQEGFCVRGVYDYPKKYVMPKE